MSDTMNNTSNGSTEKLISLANLQTFNELTEEREDTKYAALKTEIESDFPTIPEYTIISDTAETGNLATYRLAKDGVAISGSTINIPKDWLVKSGSVKTCTVENVPVEGYAVNDKYIDLVLNTKDGGSIDEHIYIKVNDLVGTDCVESVSVTKKSEYQYEISVVKNGIISKYTIDIPTVTVPTELSDLSDDETHRLVTDTEKETWNAKSDFSGSYEDLTNKPTIPSKVTDLSDSNNYYTKRACEENFINNVTLTKVLDDDDFSSYNLEVQHNDEEDIYDFTVIKSLAYLNDDTNHRVVTDSQITAWNSKSDFSGSYDDLTNKPTIPDKITDLSDSGDYYTKSDVDSGFVSSVAVADISHGESKTYRIIVTKNGTASSTDISIINHLSSMISDSQHMTVSGSEKATWDAKSDFSGKYEDLLNKPTIPSALSDLSDDSTHRTVTDEQITAWSSQSGFDGDYNHLINKPTIPSTLSELTDDETHRVVTDTEKTTWNSKSDFSGNYNDLTNKPTLFDGNYDSLTNKPTIPNKLSDLTDDSTHRVVTDTQISNWNTKTSFSGNYNDLTNKPTIPSKLSELTDDTTHRTVTDTEKTTWDNKSNFSGNYNDLTNKPTIPSITYGTDDLESGVSTLATGSLYFVYE